MNPHGRPNEVELGALRRILEHSRGTSSFTLVTCDSPALRESLFTRLQAEAIAFHRVDLGLEVADPVEEVRDKAAAAPTDPIFITGLDYLLADSTPGADGMLAVLNRSRERWRKALPEQALVFWLTTHTSVRLMTHAPDFRAWVSHELEFKDDTLHGLRPDQPSLSRNLIWLSNLDASAKGARLAELERRLSFDPPDPALFQEWARAWDERLLLLHLLGEDRRAEGEARRLMQSFQNDDVSRQWKAEVADHLVNILVARRDFDTALGILREHEIPTYDRLGDIRSAAIARGKVAAILTARGNLDEAERILREDVLPRLKEVGDLRESGMTLDRLAEVLVARGQLDAALKLRNDEVLPILREIRDDRAVAMARCGVADILRRKGDLAGALQIHREELLPIFTRLGDLRSQAATLSNIAEILQSQGQVDEAIRMIREEVLPIHERLGTTLNGVMSRVQLAIALKRRSQPPDLREAFRIMTQCLETARAQGWGEARQFESILLRWGVPLDWTRSTDLAQQPGSPRS